MSSQWVVAVDIGGTFTDVVAVELQTGDTRHIKVPSSRSHPAQAVLSGLSVLREEEKVPSASVHLILHGTTLVTNAIIERTLADTALVTTHGFRDVLEIGRHWRPELYDPFMEQPPPLVRRHHRIEAHERVSASGQVSEPLTDDEISRVVQSFQQLDVQSVAVTFLHSYRTPQHEERMAEALRAEGRWAVCASSELTREVREYERTSTTVLNAALMPIIDRYLEELESGLASAGIKAGLFVSQSNGGAQTPALARQRPINLALSGPVAGVIACTEAGRQVQVSELIGLDMGGTSTDISLITGYEPRFTNQISVGELPVRISSVQVSAIGAGGGSIAAVDPGGGLRVGPRSAGSDPGPASYGRGGTEPTVTDCQLILGRLSPDFPLAGRLQLRLALAREAVKARIARPLGMSVEEAAAGVIDVANAGMERAVRVALRDRGDDPRAFGLLPFGGAGPLHAAELAHSLGIETVVIPPQPGTFSAVGLLASDVRLDFAASELHRSDEERLADHFNRIFNELTARALAHLSSDARWQPKHVTVARSCDVRYLGQAYEVTVPVADGQIGEREIDELLAAFHERHERSYAFSAPDELCELVTLRIALVVPLETPRSEMVLPVGDVQPSEHRPVYLPGEGLQSIPVFNRWSLPAGHRVEGPAVVQQLDATMFLPDYASATVHPTGNLIMMVATAPASAAGVAVENGAPMTWLG